ncbi:MAG: nicotinate (nicotinamide) nucleotide adenylyltransferase [Pseudoflavonifractor sp.]
MKIGIYGGTFNPPHLGHMTAAGTAMAALGLQKLFLVPAAIPPHKALPPGTAPAADRLAMAGLMADGLGQALARPDDVTALDLELQRQGKSYTADTLAELHDRYPADELYLLMGTDMFLTLQNWQEPQKIADLATIVAFARSEADCGAPLQVQAEYLRTTFGARVNLVQLPQITDISSTELRQSLAQGGGQDLLWTQVYGYILRKGLYGVQRDLKNLSDGDLRAASYSMMRAKRIPHVQGTEQAAVALAERWGADIAHARRAAILHDCTKYLGMAEQTQICAAHGVALDCLEQSAVKLLHAKTGACLAREIYGASDDIYEAIFWHTTGKADMSLLEKIIYLADYMEPTRDFPGVETLRSLAQTDLDGAVLMGFEMSVAEMAERGLPVHHNTLEAQTWMWAHRN